jgi:hypothetical protein
MPSIYGVVCPPSDHILIEFKHLNGFYSKQIPYQLCCAEIEECVSVRELHMRTMYTKVLVVLDIY